MHLNSWQLVEAMYRFTRVGGGGRGSEGGLPHGQWVLEVSTCVSYVTAVHGTLHAVPDM